MFSGITGVSVINSPLTQFVPGTHLLFSCSKDITVKCWDADTFDHIMTLEVHPCNYTLSHSQCYTFSFSFTSPTVLKFVQGHCGEVWCLAVSHDGDTVVSEAC